MLSASLPVAVHPHVRGEMTIPLSGVNLSRFTPTCVGNTWPLPQNSPRPAWHRFPHVRGGIRSAALNWIVSQRAGSLPRAWGILECLMSIRELRFTPTCVGNTSIAPETDVPPPFTPRVGNTFSLPFIGFGSPPRAWGIPSQQRERLVHRFTPRAWGNTKIVCTWPCPVHPHVRGEYRSSVRCQSTPVHPTCVGIPLVLSVQPQRFTPTCVGNTVN